MQKIDFKEMNILKAFLGNIISKYFSAWKNEDGIKGGARLWQLDENIFIISHNSSHK